ncbi:MAG: YkvA family protein [Bacteroidota bacterium]
MPDTNTTARRGLRLAQDQTDETVEEPGRLRALANRAGTKLSQQRGSLGTIRSDLPLLIRFVRAYVKGDYRRIPWKALVMAAGALVYFVMPVDLIPDFLVGTGFLDDAAVIAYVIKSLRDDLKQFEAWEAGDA